MVADLAARLATQPRWVLIFLAGLTLGSAWGTYWTLKKVEQFFGKDEMERFRAAERASFANRFANPS